MRKGFYGNFAMTFYSIGLLLSYFLGIRFGDFEFGYADVALIAVGITISSLSS